MYSDSGGDFGVWKQKLKENGALWEGRTNSYIREDDTGELQTLFVVLTEL